MFETKFLAHDLTIVDRDDEPDVVVLDSAATAGPRNDDAQRQRIVARHLAAVADHVRNLLELEKSTGRNS
jgi:hypothetical protein